MQFKTITATTPKSDVFDQINQYLTSLGFSAINIDIERPWGGFFVINESQTQQFIQTYFPELSTEAVARGGRLSPKILVLEPHKRFSWQYHDRREELWSVLLGPLHVHVSQTDDLGEPQLINEGQTIQFGIHTRHRLTALDNWGIVAEIWQHTDANNPSDDDDIVRVQDDFNRS